MTAGLWVACFGAVYLAAALVLVAMLMRDRRGRP